MSPLHAVRRRFRYHAWATRRLAEAVAQTPASGALRPLAHLLVADRVWLLRLQGEPTEAVALWPDLNAGGCDSLAARNAEAYASALGALTEADLHATVTFRTSTGATYETAVEDVLDHVLLHAAHHRGQVNAALRAAGAEPPGIDFIVWVRAGEPTP